MTAPQSLKTQVLKGGIYLTLRQLLATFFSLISALVIARILGPEKYGVVAIALGSFYFWIMITKLGLNVYLVRQPDLAPDAPSQILAFFNTVGLVLCLLLTLSAPLMGWWTKSPDVTSVMRWVPLALWLEMVGKVPLTLLERQLRFAEIGLVETLSQMTNYAVAVPLVMLGWGYWGPIAGLVVQFALLAILSYRYHPVPWQLHWTKKLIQPALRYGLTFVGADWIGSLRSLTVPIVVSRLAGVETAGIVSFTIRFVEQLSILRIVVRRMSLSILAKLVENPAFTRSAISRGMAYQVLMLGPACAVFSCCALWVIPLVFGQKWLMSGQVFPFVALAALLSAPFDLHIAALFAAGRNFAVAQLNLGYILLLWLACWLLLPRLGLWGYGAAELLALPSFWIVHHALTRVFGSPNYAKAEWLTLATTPALLAGPWISPWIGLGILLASYGLLLIVKPDIRELLLELYTTWRTKQVPSVQA